MSRTWLQRLLLSMLVLTMLLCFALAGALGYVSAKVGRIQRISLGGALAGSDSQSAGGTAIQNILLTGVDSSEGLDPNDPRMQGRSGETNTDTIMLLRLDPAQTKAQLLSFARDLLVPLGGGSGSKDKINAALAIGGPDLLIRTITANFGIQINHYVQVDFAEFQTVVNSLGGVPVAFDKPVRDTMSGLDIPKPGCVTLNGEQALNYVRSRYFEYYEDGQWKYDGWADLSRIDRQQDFMRRAIKRASVKVVRNPVTLNRFLNAALSAVTVDDRFKTSDIVGLASRFRSFNPDTFQTYTLPVVPETYGDASVVRLVDNKAKPILDVFRGINPSDISTASVQVTVLNGSGRPNEGRNTANALQGVGFRIDIVGDAPTSGLAQTVIRYRPDDQAAADLLARYLTSPPQLQAAADLNSPGIQLTTGLDYNGVLGQPRPPAPTTTTTTVPGTPAPGPTTSPTTVGVVPSNGGDQLCKAT